MTETDTSRQDAAGGVCWVKLTPLVVVPVLRVALHAVVQLHEDGLQARVHPLDQLVVHHQRPQQHAQSCSSTESRADVARRDKPSTTTTLGYYHVTFSSISVELSDFSVFKRQFAVAAILKGVSSGRPDEENISIAFGQKFSCLCHLSKNNHTWWQKLFNQYLYFVRYLQGEIFRTSYIHILHKMYTQSGESASICSLLYPHQFSWVH